MSSNSQSDTADSQHRSVPQIEVVRFLCGFDTVFAGNTLTGTRGTPGVNQPQEKADVLTTHCAHLILHKDLVFKIKRALSYSYIDMTSLSKRKRLCQRELELNQPELPDIYIDVVPVTIDDSGQLELNGSGVPVEWVLRMNRFAECDVLDNVAKDGKLTLELADRLGKSLAQYHHRLNPLQVVDGHDRMAEIVSELRHEFSVLVSPLPTELTSQFHSLAQSALDSCRAQLDARGESGFIKRCHGDLHLRNILLRNDQPVPFDALEFDERLGTCDVLYDLAFLIMDLGHRQLQEQENRVLNQYLMHSAIENTSALSLMPLFLACRAAIRAMTSAQVANAASDNTNAGLEEATSYLRLAIAYLSVDKPTLIAVGGVSGSGKSTASQRLPARIACSPGAILLRSDVERKRLAGIDEYRHLPQSHYTLESSTILHEHLRRKASSALSAGYSVVMDATFLGEAEQQRIIELAHTLDVRFVGLWLTAPEDTLKSRISLRENDASDATLDVLDLQLSKSRSTAGWHVIDASGDRDETLQRCLECIVEANL